VGLQADDDLAQDVVRAIQTLFPEPNGAYYTAGAAFQALPPVLP